MSDTVFEYPSDDPVRGQVSFTRFWKGGEDWVQITLIHQGEDYPLVHTFASLPFKKFEEGYLALRKSVADTGDAWWHIIGKEVSKT